jgi:hypothetical protein
MSNKYSPDNYGDDILDDIDKERKALSAKRDDNNVKLDTDGDTWLLRFLPAHLGMGERKRFYAPIAQHWVNKRPHFCARVTPPECGGDPDAPCGLCDLSEEIRSSYENTNRDLSSFGYKAGASKQWLTYALVWSKENKGQEPWTAEGDERWQPYRFWLNKTNFDDLLEYYRRFLQKRPDNKYSILDPEIGVDFIVKRANNKISLQKDESRPIYDEGWNEQEKADLLTYILDKIKMPSYHALGAEEMDAACAKLEEAFRKLEASSARPRTRSLRSSSSVDENEEQPRVSRPAAPAPRPAVASRPPAPAPRPAAPAPRTAVAPAAARPSLPPTAPRSVPSARTSLPPRPAPVQEDEDDIPFDDMPTASVAPSAPVPTPSSRLRQAARQAEPQAPTRSTATSSVDEDDDVTDEQHDHVPQASAEGIEDAPPTPVEQIQTSSTRPVSRMSAKLRSAISRTQ